MELVHAPLERMRLLVQGFVSSTPTQPPYEFYSTNALLSTANRFILFQLVHLSGWEYQLLKLLTLAQYSGLSKPDTQQNKRLKIKLYKLYWKNYIKRHIPIHTY